MMKNFKNKGIKIKLQFQKFIYEIIYQFIMELSVIMVYDFTSQIITLHSISGLIIFWETDKIHLERTPCDSSYQGKDFPKN